MNLGEKLRNAVEKLKNAAGFDNATIKEVVKEIQRALITSDVEIKLVLEVSKKIEQEAKKDVQSGLSKKEHIIKKTHEILSDLLGGDTIEPPAKPKSILLVGLFGSGKTVSSTKIAHYYSKKGLNVGIIGADTFRPAALIQLKQFSKSVNIDVFGIEDEKDAEKVVKEGIKHFSKKDLIIIDSAGRSSLDDELILEMKRIYEAAKPEYSFLVLSADIGQIAKKQALGFSTSVPINGVIITKMDGSAKGGGALAACKTTNSPVYFIGVGEKVDEFQEFEPTRYLSRIMGYGDLKGLLEKVKQLELKENDVSSMLKGNFSLQDFYDQLNAARSLGPLNKVMDMMGVGRQIPKEAMELGEEKLTGFRVIMDSMTKQEKNKPELFNSNRVERVSKGSGKKLEEVRELLRNYKTMKKMFKEVKGMDLQKPDKMDMNSLFSKMQKKKKRKLKLR